MSEFKRLLLLLDTEMLAKMRTCPVCSRGFIIDHEPPWDKLMGFGVGNKFVCRRTYCDGCFDEAVATLRRYVDRAKNEY